MKTKLIPLVILIAIILMSCALKIQSFKYEPNIKYKKTDIFYHLPKTVIKLIVTYKIDKKMRMENGLVDSSLAEKTISVKNIELSTIPFNDMSQFYVARGKNLAQSFFLKETMDVNFNDKGIIQTVDATYEDKSPEAIESLLIGISQIAKTVITGTRVDGEKNATIFIDSIEKDISKKISTTYQSLSSALSAKDEKKIEFLTKQLSRYTELLKSYKEKNHVVISTNEEAYTYYIDFEKPITNNQKLEYEIPNVYGQPKIMIIINNNNTIENDLKERFTSNYLKVKTRNKQYDTVNSVPGLLYKIPAPLLTSIYIYEPEKDSVCYFQKLIEFSQYGYFGYVPVTSKLFTNKRTNITFDPLNGTLRKYSTESGSSSENILKTFEKSAKLLNTTIKEIQYDDKIEALNKQKTIKQLQSELTDKKITQIDSIKNTIELIELQVELKKIQSKLDSLNKN